MFSKFDYLSILWLGLWSFLLAISLVMATQVELVMAINDKSIFEKEEFIYSQPQLITTSHKLVNQSIVQPNEIITYTIIISSPTITSIGVSFVDTLPTELSVGTQIMASQGVATIVDDSDTVIWTGTASRQQPATVTYNAIVNDDAIEGDMITNKVRISNETETVTKTATIVVQSPRLSIAKMVDTPDTISVADMVTYTILISNSGLGTAHDVLVVDNLPISVTGRSLNQEVDIGPGETISFTIPVFINNNAELGQKIINTASYSYNLETGQATASFTLSKPSLQIAKQVTLPRNPAWFGDTVTYTIIITNNGDGIAEDVRVIDNMPSEIDGDELDTKITVPPYGGVVRLELSGIISKALSPDTVTIVNMALFSHASGFDEVNASFIAIKPRWYLPLLIKQTPSPTLTPTPTETPAPISTPVLPHFENPNFDLGNEDWEEDSRQNLSLIVNRSELNDDVKPHSNDYLAWLGGRNNEEATLSQEIEIASGFSDQNLQLFLGYWYWFGSEDMEECGDVGYVEIELNSQRERIFTSDLCENSGGWRYRAVKIDVAKYEGKTVTFYFVIDNDNRDFSSWFLDDIYFQYSDTTPN